MAKKRYLCIPEAIQVRNNDGTVVHEMEPPSKMGDAPIDLGEAKPVSLSEWVCKAMLEVNPDFWENYAAISASNSIRAALKADVGEMVELEEDDWKFLNDALQKPKHQYRETVRNGFGYYRPDLMWQFQPFMDAIHGASPVKPSKD